MVKQTEFNVDSRMDTDNLSLMIITLPIMRTSIVHTLPHFMITRNSTCHKGTVVHAWYKVLPNARMYSAIMY